MDIAKKICLGLIIAGLIGFGIGATSLVTRYNENKDIVDRQYYSGREYFLTEEYQEFKVYLADHPEVTIQELEMLSSDDPLVFFEVITYDGKTFPWGEVTHTTHKADSFSSGVWIFFMTLGLVLFIRVCSIPWTEQEAN